MASVIKQLKAGKSHKTCLTNHIWSISHHITPLVINALGAETQTHTHIRMREPKQFQESRYARARSCGLHVPGIKRYLLWYKQLIAQ